VLGCPAYPQPVKHNNIPTARHKVILRRLGPLAPAATLRRGWLAIKREIIGKESIVERWIGKLLDRGTCEVQVLVLFRGQSYSGPLEQVAVPMI
jgi:hypothetical protein